MQEVDEAFNFYSMAVNANDESNEASILGI